MAFVCRKATMLIVIASSVVVHVECSATRHFRGQTQQPYSAVSDVNTVATADIELSLRASMEAALAGDAMMSQRTAMIEKRIWQTFQALPKNALGRMAPKSVRYIAHSYFAKEHGWLIKGLEPHGNQPNMSEFHDASILQDKAPALVEALLEARRSDQGLALSDVVIMIAVLERLIFNESISLLESSYMFNNVSPNGHVGETALHDVLTSYLLVFEMGMRGNNLDATTHQAIKTKVAKAGGSWQTLVEFEQDAVHNFEYRSKDRRNPFIPPQMSFEQASEIVGDLAETYGKWQNSECRQMKEDLEELDHDGSGHVPLSVFYSQPDTADYQFTESVEYLREIGALDERAGMAPRVRIANYLAGPSNCIASHTYYSVCCLSDCESLMTELEGKIEAPTATPERLLSLVSNLASDAIHVPADLMQKKDLIAKLQSIADRHAGQVPLHGRLFAQWLHHAFPSDCPFPYMVADSQVLTPGHWSERQANAAEEDRQRHIENHHPASLAVDSNSLHWHDEEVLPLLEPAQPRRSVIAGAFRIIMQLSMFLVVLRVAIGTFRSTAAASRGVSSGKKDALPF